MKNALLTLTLLTGFGTASYAVDEDKTVKEICEMLIALNNAELAEIEKKREKSIDALSKFLPHMTLFLSKVRDSVNSNAPSDFLEKVRQYEEQYAKVEKEVKDEKKRRELMSALNRHYRRSLPLSPSGIYSGGDNRPAMGISHRHTGELMTDKIDLYNGGGSYENWPLAISEDLENLLDQYVFSGTIYRINIDFLDGKAWLSLSPGNGSSNTAQEKATGTLFKHDIRISIIDGEIRGNDIVKLRNDLNAPVSPYDDKIDNLRRQVFLPDVCKEKDENKTLINGDSESDKARQGENLKKLIKKNSKR